MRPRPTAHARAATSHASHSRVPGERSETDLGLARDRQLDDASRVNPTCVDLGRHEWIALRDSCAGSLVSPLAQGRSLYSPGTRERVSAAPAARAGATHPPCDPMSRSPRSAGEPLRPLNRIHAVGFPAGLIEAARLAERGLNRGKVVGRGPAAAFRLLRRREAAAVLALHVLRRSGAALRGLAHGGGRRMLLARAAARLRGWAAALRGLIHRRSGRMLRPP